MERLGIDGRYVLGVVACRTQEGESVHFQEFINCDCVQRNIAYNLLTLRPPQGRLAELYAAMNPNPDTPSPWFELRSSFTLSAASIVSLQPVKGIPFHDSLKPSLIIH